MKVFKIISKIEELFISVLLFILIVFTFVNVFLRYIFDYSILGSVEISVLLFAWIIFIGSSIAINQGVHIKIDILNTILPPKINKILTVIIEIIILVVCIALSYFGFDLSFKVMSETLGSTNIPKITVYLALPVGFALSSIHLIENLIWKKAEEGGS